MSSALGNTQRTQRRLPFLVYALGAGTFLMGTTEFIVAGLLPEISQDLGVSVADAGLMITVFAIGMIVGTPVVAIATIRLPRPLTLGLSLGIFAVGHVVVALGSNLYVILGARFTTALATGAFWAVAAVVGARATGQAASAKALGIVIGGGMLANVAGVPLGAFAGQLIGWRGPFWVLAAIAVVGAFACALMPADDEDQPAPSIRAEFRGLRDVRVWVVLAGCAAVTGSSLAVYSFIAPLLTTTTGLPSSAVPAVLVAYGIGAFIGSTLGGRVGSQRPYKLLFVAAGMTFVVLLGLCFFAAQPVVTVTLVTLLGLFGMATNPILIGMAVRFAGQAPTLASALSTSSFNVGTAIGSWIAALSLGTSLQAVGPVVVGTVIAALYAVPLLVLYTGDRKAAAARRSAVITGQPATCSAV